MHKRRSKEELFLEKIEKENRRELKKIEKEKKLAEKNQKKLIKEPSEEELVLKYVNRVIMNQAYHNRIDQSKFEGLEYKSNTKNLWMDTDFYFSVVFQSSKQKFEFLEKWEQIHKALEDEDEQQLNKFKIVNGLRLAEALGISLIPETVKDYPTGNLDLMRFCLDDKNT